MKLSQFKFDLPLNLIAQNPSKNREESRLMIVHRKTGKIEHKVFHDIKKYFHDKDVMVVNNTKVFSARLYGKKEKFIKSNHITYEIDTLDVPHVIDIEIYDRLNNLDDELLANDKIKSFVDYFSETIKIHFSKEDDFLIANAFLEILKNSDSINFSTNQKSIYFLVKEQTGCRQSDILRILKRIRRIYGRVIFETDNK